MLVQEDIAELAKEKGFNVKCRDWFCEGILSEDDEELSNNDPDYCGDWVSAPSQTKLQTWLRDVHNIEAYAVPTYHFKSREYQGYYGFIEDLKPVTGPMGGYLRYFKYEDSLETALFEALKLI